MNATNGLVARPHHLHPLNLHRTLAGLLVAEHEAEAIDLGLRPEIPGLEAGLVPGHRFAGLAAGSQAVVAGRDALFLLGGVLRRLANGGEKREAHGNSNQRNMMEHGGCLQT